MTNKVHKNLVLFVLFIVPLLFYILLQISTHNFGKLPISVKGVTDISEVSKQEKFKTNVTVIVFSGNNFENYDAELFNLNEKIYKKFYGYSDFQLLIIVPEGKEKQVEKLKKRITLQIDMQKWKFVFLSNSEISLLFKGLKTGETLDKNYHSSQAYIIDKELNLRRSKTKDKINQDKKGYNMSSVSELKNEMHDDVKILLAEYRLALKKNKRKRKI